MKVLLCLTKHTPRGKYILECFAKGCRKLGDKTQWLTENDHDVAGDMVAECDVAIQICTANKHDTRVGSATFRHSLHKLLSKKSKRTVVIDSGYFMTQTELELNQDVNRPKHKFDPRYRRDYESIDKSVYYQVGYDGLKAYAAYYNENSPPGRWSALGIPIKPWISKNAIGKKTDDRHILILGQTFQGASSQHINIYNWYEKAAKKIRENSDRKIVFRQHPRLFKQHRKRQSDLKGVLKALRKSNPASVSVEWELHKDLENAYAAVAFSSNAAVYPIVNGVPTFVDDPGCVAYPMSAGDLKNIESPVMPQREQWLADLAYAQWNCEEMSNGECWKHLRKYAEK